MNTIQEKFLEAMAIRHERLISESKKLFAEANDYALTVLDGMKDSSITSICADQPYEDMIYFNAQGTMYSISNSSLHMCAADVTGCDLSDIDVNISIQECLEAVYIYYTNYVDFFCESSKQKIYPPFKLCVSRPKLYSGPKDNDKYHFLDA